MLYTTDVIVVHIYANLGQETNIGSLVNDIGDVAITALGVWEDGTYRDSRVKVNVIRRNVDVLTMPERLSVEVWAPDHELRRAKQAHALSMISRSVQSSLPVGVDECYVTLALAPMMSIMLRDIKDAGIRATPDKFKKEAVPLRHAPAQTPAEEPKREELLVEPIANKAADAQVPLFEPPVPKQEPRKG